MLFQTLNRKMLQGHDCAIVVETSSSFPQSNLDERYCSRQPEREVLHLWRQDSMPISDEPSRQTDDCSSMLEEYLKRVMLDLYKLPRRRMNILRICIDEILDDSTETESELN